MLSSITSRIFCLSISFRIIAITAFSSFAALALLCSISVYRDTKAFEKAKVEELDTLAQILESNTQAALRFNDPYRAKEYVDSLASVQDIQSVSLFDSEGSLFARYAVGNASNPPSPPSFIGKMRESGRIWYSRDIMLDGSVIGKILIELDTSSLIEANRRNILISFALFLGGLLLAIILAAWLQKSITVPARQLLEATRRVTRTKDYTTKAPKVFKDEIGSLVDGFNAMLETVRQQDEELRQINAGLEKTVEDRTKDLQARNEALRKAMEAANAASIAKSEFLATTSHELRTPLNPIIGYVEMLLWRNPEREDRRELELIKQSAEQLLRLIDDILDFSRIERGTIQLAANDVHIPSLCQDTIALMKQEAASKDLQLSYRDISSDHSSSKFVKIDEGRLRQIFLNLIGNALKFTRQGSILLESDLRQSNNVQSLLRIKVSDTGIGISPENLTKLFKPFSQIDGSLTRKYGGMGLGLAISKKIVDAMNGELRCASVPNKGTTFTIEIPVTTSEGVIPAKQRESLGVANDQPRSSILLVEDEAVNRELVRSLLITFGHQVTCAVDGIDAIEKWKEARQEFDLILLDISMPRLDGYATAQAIRKTETPEHRIPIVAMTAHARPSDRQKCMEAGMDDYLSKPLSFSKLSDTLKHWLSKTSKDVTL